MSLLIYGVTGFLGAGLARYFSETTDVYGVASRVNCHPNTMKYLTEYFAYDETTNYIKKTNPKIIIFCISLDHKRSEENHVYTLKTNIEIYAKLLEEAKQSNFSGKIIYISTAQVLQDQDPYLEKINIKNTYGLTHFYCEKIGEISNNLNVLNVRLPNVVGVEVSPEANIRWTLIPSLIDSVFEKQKLSILSDGTPKRTFISLNDICFSIHQIIKKYERKSINILSNQKYTVAEVLRIVETSLKNHGVKYELAVPDKFDHAATVSKELAYTPDYCHSLKDYESLEAIVDGIIKNKKDHLKCK